MNKFWNWVRNKDNRTLYLNGTIAEESWFDDDVTPAAFKAELLSGEGDITVWINSPAGTAWPPLRFTVCSWTTRARSR